MDAEAVSKYLIDQGYLLTALELCAELCENGTPLKTLTDYFADASNFERSTGHEGGQAAPAPARRHHARSLSIESANDDTFSRMSTTESVDIVREKDEMITVLEYELRQAQDTIEKLRSRLTASATGGAAIPSAPAGDRKALKGTIQSIESRSLNYLVNEFLADSGFRMSAIALADENGDQDLEDWKDVGLDVDPPPPLIQLLRAYQKYNEVKTGKTREADLIRRLEEENDKLRAKVARLESAVAAAAAAAAVAPSTHSVEQAAKDDAAADAASGDKEESAPAPSAVVAEPEPAPSTGLAKRKKGLPVYRLLAKVAPSTVPLTRLDVEVARVARGEQTSVIVVGRALPAITPSVLLAHRQELLPMILTVVKHHQDPATRDQITHLLFNLFKKPDETQRCV